MRRWLLLLFLATMAIDWPQLAFNARITDIIFVAAAIAILIHQQRWMRPRLTFLDVAIAGYLAGSVPAIIFSPDVRAGAIEFIREGYLVAIYVVIALAVRQGLAVTVASGMALSGAVLATVGVIAVLAKTLFNVTAAALTPVMTLPYIGDTVRLRALTASEAMLACLLAMSVPFVAAHPLVTASRIRAAGSAVVLGIAALLTYSHAIAGIAVSTLIASWRSIRSRPPLRMAAAAVTVLIVVALNFAASISIRSIGASPFRDDTVFYYAVDSGRAEIGGVTVDYQTMSYLRLKQVAWDAFSASPLVGIGLDRFHRVTEIAHAQGRLTARYRAIDPHSTFFGRFAETGIIGGGTLIILWIAIAVACDRLRARDPDHWIALAVTAGIVGTAVNSINADVMNFRFLWVALGLVRGLMAQATTTETGRAV